MNIEGTHARKSSDTGSVRKAPSVKGKAQAEASPIKQRTKRVRYTLLVQLPFPRGDFEDPPQVEWDLDKDRDLWKIIANTPAIGSLDWSEVAAEFQVPLPFILQQAAWLYQRHMENVREQMRKVGASTVASPGAGGQPSTTASQAKRLSIGGRTPSSLSVRSKESPLPRASEFIPTETVRPAGPSRTPSTNTITQSRMNTVAQPPSPRQPLQSSFRSSMPPPRAPVRRMDTLASETDGTRASSPSPPASSSSSSSSESEGPIRRSKILRKPQGRLQSQKKPGLSTLDDEEASSSDDTPIFSTVRSKGTEPANDSAETSSAPSPAEKDRGIPRGPKGKGKVLQPLSSSASSESSASRLPSGETQARGKQPRIPDALSPRHRAELARLHLGGRRVSGKNGQGSDGTPSMGSSFSDLDGVYIPQAPAR